MNVWLSYRTFIRAFRYRYNISNSDNDKVNKITKIGYRNNSCSGCAYCCLLGTATAFYVGLRGKVTALEKQLQRLEKHSLLFFMISG